MWGLSCFLVPIEVRGILDWPRRGTICGFWWAFHRLSMWCLRSFWIVNWEWVGNWCPAKSFDNRILVGCWSGNWRWDFKYCQFYNHQELTETTNEKVKVLSLIRLKSHNFRRETNLAQPRNTPRLKFSTRHLRFTSLLAWCSSSLSLNISSSSSSSSLLIRAIFQHAVTSGLEACRMNRDINLLSFRPFGRISISLEWYFFSEF